MNAKVLCYIISLSILSVCAVETITTLDGLETNYKNKKLENVIVKPDLTLADFSGWIIINVMFSEKSDGNTNFSGATIKGVNNLNTIFSSSLKNVIFQNAKLDNVVFEGVVSNGSFKQATLTNVTFRADVSGTFDGATLTNVCFNGTYQGSFAAATVVDCSDKDGKTLAIKDGQLVLFVQDQSPSLASEKK